MVLGLRLPRTLTAILVGAALRLVGSARPPLLASTVYGAAIVGAPYLIWLLVRDSRAAGT